MTSQTCGQVQEDWSVGNADTPTMVAKAIEFQRRGLWTGSDREDVQRQDQITVRAEDDYFFEH